MGKIITHTACKTDAFRLCLINSISNFIKTALIEIDCRLESYGVLKSSTLAEFLYHYGIFLKKTGSSRNNARYLKRKLQRKNFKKLLKPFLNKMSILENSQALFMGFHNTIINDHIIEHLLKMKEVRMDISSHISLLKYSIPMNDSICFFGIIDNNQNFDFFSLTQFMDSYANNNYNMKYEFFIPITPNKILTSSIKAKEAIEKMDQKSLISTIAATSYEFFIANNDTFNDYIPLIGEKNNNKLFEKKFIAELLTNINDPDPLVLYCYKELFLKLEKDFTNKSLNYSKENRDTDNMDLATQFFN